MLTVSRDLGLKEPYIGSVELVTGEIAEDLAQYMVESEQIPAAVGLGVLVDTDRTIKAAGGFIVQLMPGAPEELIAKLEDNIFYMDQLTTVLDEDGPGRRARAGAQGHGAPTSCMQRAGGVPLPVQPRARCAAALATIAARGAAGGHRRGRARHRRGQLSSFADKQYSFHARGAPQARRRGRSGLNKTMKKWKLPLDNYRGCFSIMTKRCLMKRVPSEA